MNTMDAKTQFYKVKNNFPILMQIDLLLSPKHISIHGGVDYRWHAPHRSSTEIQTRPAKGISTDAQEVILTSGG